MSLPQRKKSAEEIAKLRESLGIGGLPAVEPPVTESAPVPAAAKPPIEEVPAPPKIVEIPRTEILPTPAPAVSPVLEPQEPKVVRSLKRSERVPVLSVDLSGPPPHSSSLREPAPIPAATPLPSQHPAKIVRSLRKSEQGPLPAVHAPPKDSPLPVHRHSDAELAEIRRRQMLAQATASAPPPVLSAHPVLYTPAYLLVFGSAAAIYFYDVSKLIPAVCVALALVIATFIFVKKPLSRHHSAFIAVIALFVVVFGALYYFPQLQHGT
jgi:hypothetical protein